MSYLQVADGALDEVTSLLTRASQLAQQAQTGTISDSNRSNLDAEFQNILTTMATSAPTPTSTAGHLHLGRLRPLRAGRRLRQHHRQPGRHHRPTPPPPWAWCHHQQPHHRRRRRQRGQTLLATALDSVSTMRASIGADEAGAQRHLQHPGHPGAELHRRQSQITDANVADEVVNLTKYQILQQSGTSALAKSNTSAQQILALLQ